MTARYRVIAGALQERIATGEFDVGHLLPTEAELCDEFRASRFTVREALRRLEDAGLVARRQGSGTARGQPGTPAALRGITQQRS